MKTKRFQGDAVRLKLAEKDTTPKWHLLFPMGATKYREDFPREGITFSREFCSKLVSNFKKSQANYQGADDYGLQVNYHHLGGFTVEAGAPMQNLVAAGWITDMELRAEGPYALIRYTERAREYIRADEFRYLSPEFFLDYADRSSGLSQGPTLAGAALTNDPFLKELPRVAASDTTTEVATATEEGAVMDKKKLCARLGLPENATDEQIEAKLAAMDSAAKKADEVQKTAAVQMSEVAGKVEKLSEVITSSNTRIATLETENKALKEGELAREVKAFVDGLVTEGKIVPAQHEEVSKFAAKDLALAKSVYAKAAKVIALGPVGADGAAPAAATADDAVLKLREASDKIAKEKGISFSEAKDIAIAQNPELAKKAWRATSSSRAS